MNNSIKTWFCASIVSVVVNDEKEQDEFPVFEDFYLFSADSKDELHEKINRQIELINQAGEEGMNYSGHPAKQKCIGVRKIREIFSDHIDGNGNSLPADGAEVSHSFFIVHDIETAKQIAAGNRVVVNYVDDSNQ